LSGTITGRSKKNKDGSIFAKTRRINICAMAVMAENAKKKF
jgi:hypothetical protein